MVGLDAQHQETRVTLYDVQLGGTFDPDLFVFIDPSQPGGASKVAAAEAAAPMPQQ